MYRSLSAVWEDARGRGLDEGRLHRPALCLRLRTTVFDLVAFLFERSALALVVRLRRVKVLLQLRLGLHVATRSTALMFLDDVAAVHVSSVAARGVDTPVGQWGDDSGPVRSRGPWGSRTV